MIFLIAEMQSGVFFFFTVLFHYHQSELLHFPVSHLVCNYGGVRVAAESGCGARSGGALWRSNGFRLGE